MATHAPLTEAEARVIGRCWEDFHTFVTVLWGVLEPSTPFVAGLHTEIVCEAIQRQVVGEPAYRYLCLCVPPGTAKSRMLSVFGTVYGLWRNPGARFFCLSTSDSVATRDSRFARLVILSPVFQRMAWAVAQQRKERPWTLAPDQAEKTNWETTARGARLCSAMGAALTGERGDHVIVDDPVDVMKYERASPDSQRVILDEAWATCQYVFHTRVNQSRTARRTLIMQRVAKGDPVERAMGEGGWKVVCLPMEGRPTNPWRHERDGRVEGELLAPALFDAADIAKKRKALGVASYEAQYQQEPRLVDGGLFTRELVNGLRRWVEVPGRFDEELITVDATFKGLDTSDRVAIHHYGRVGADIWLTDRDCRRLGYRDTKAAIVAMRARHPGCRVVLVEDKANGSAVLDDLGAELPGLVPFAPGVKSKWERAKVALLPLLEARNVWLPARNVCPWVEEVEASWCGFVPNGRDDDDVDAATMMAVRWGLGVGGAPWLGSEVVAEWREGGGAVGEPPWDVVVPGRRYLGALMERPGRAGEWVWVVLDERGATVDAGEGVEVPSVVRWPGLVVVPLSEQARREAKTALLVDGRPFGTVRDVEAGLAALRQWAQDGMRVPDRRHLDALAEVVERGGELCGVSGTVKLFAACAWGRVRMGWDRGPRRPAVASPRRLDAWGLRS